MRLEFCKVIETQTQQRDQKHKSKTKQRDKHKPSKDGKWKPWRRLQAAAWTKPRWRLGLKPKRRKLELNEEQKGLFKVWFGSSWCREWRTKGFVLGVWFRSVDLENEEQRKKRKNNEWRKGRAVGQQERKLSV